MIIESAKSILSKEKCPQCSGTGKFFEHSINIPISKRILFFNVSLNIKLNIKYCANCGFLRVTVG